MPGSMPGLMPLVIHGGPLRFLGRGAAIGTLLLLSLLLSGLTAAGRADAEAGRPVGMELILLIDVSASVDSAEYALQAQGLARAFASRPVREAIATIGGGLAVAVIQWGDKANQHRALGWEVIRDGADAERFSQALAAMPRLIPGGHTALGDALAKALQELESNGYQGLRRVIDLSGDGLSNDGQPLRSARRAVLDRGITINGLAILNELPLLADYFRDNLIGGQSAFVVTAADYVDFATVIAEKLVREIGAIPVAQRDRPAGVSRPPTALAARLPCTAPTIARSNWPIVHYRPWQGRTNLVR